MTLRDIKVKPKADKPKVREKTALLPRDVSNQMRKYYLKQQEKRMPREQENSDTYATDSIEAAAVNSGFASANATKRATQYAGRKLKNQGQQDDVNNQDISDYAEPYGDMTNSVEHPSAADYHERGRTAFRRKAQIKDRPDNRYPTEDSAYIGNRDIYAYRQSTRSMQETAKQQATIKAKIKTSYDWKKPALHEQNLDYTQRVTIKTKQTDEEGNKNPQYEVQKRMIWKAAHAAKVTAKVTKKTAATLGKAVVSSVKALGTAIATGGWIAVLIVAVVIFGIVASVAASPFGIFFSDEDTSANTVPISQVVAEQNAAFAAEINTIVQDNDHDRMTLTGNMADWADILAVFAVKTAGSKDNAAMDVITIDPARAALIREVFNDMNTLSYTVEIVESGEEQTEKILNITITSKNADEMAEIYNFTNTQLEMLDAILEERAMLYGIIGNLTICS